MDVKPETAPTGALKDPLHKGATPYEVLGVERGAAKADVEKAFAMALRKRVAPHVAKAARDVLADEKKFAERALCDVLMYDGEHLGRLRPNPLQDPSVLDAGNRRKTAEAWEREFKARFPDTGIAHCLGVLWYWWSLDEEERQDRLVERAPAGALRRKTFSRNILLKAARKAEGVRCDPGTADCPHADCDWRKECGSSAPPLEEMWGRTIVYWSLLSASPDAWDGRLGLSASGAKEVRRKVEDSLRNRLADQGQKYSQKLGSEHPLAHRYRQLEQSLASELKTAKVMAASGYRTKRGRVCAGVEMLRWLGLLEKMRSQVEVLLRETPNSPGLRRLRHVLTKHFELAELLDATPPRPEEALRRIDAMPAKERSSKEVTQLRGRAFMLLGRQQVSVGRLDDALESWGQALDAPLGEEARRDVQREVVETCQAEALKRQHRDIGRAVDILEMGLVLVTDGKLEMMLAEMLVSRAIGVFNKGQETLKANPGAAGRRRIVQEFRKAKGDLERAAKLGSKRAADNLKIAENVLQQLDAQGRDGLSGLTDKAKTLLQQANAAAGRQDWEAAVDRLRQAMKLVGTRPPAMLKKNLAVSLANRAVKKANKAVEELGRTAKAHQAGVSALMAKMKSHTDTDECALCHKSKYSAVGERWFTVRLVDGTTAELCGPCTAKLQALQENTPEPDPDAVALLQAADADLTEAAALDPSSEYVKKNRNSLNGLLSKIPGGVAGTGSPAAKRLRSMPKQPRKPTFGAGPPSVTRPRSPSKRPRKQLSRAASKSTGSGIRRNIWTFVASTWWIWLILWVLYRGCG